MSADDIEPLDDVELEGACAAMPASDSAVFDLDDDEEEQNRELSAIMGSCSADNERVQASVAFPTDEELTDHEHEVRV